MALPAQPMTDQLDRLLLMLAENGIWATPEQAERLAVRVSGSVDAYITELELTGEKLKDYRPLDGPCSDKFSQPLAYYVEPRVLKGRK